MYLRTTQRKNKNGTVTKYYQLAHNERHPVTKKPVAKIIHSFGRADSIERDSLVRLCNSIARVAGLTVEDSSADKNSQGADWPNDVKLIKTVGLGCVWVIEALWKRLEIDQTFKNIETAKGVSVPYERAIFAMVANRLCEPESKLGVWDRWLSKVYLPSCQGLKLDNMYEAMDLFHEHVAKVERDIFFGVANLLNLDVDLIFYDTTTASFQIDQEDEDSEGLRKFTRGKDGNWGPHIMVALAVTRDGFPVKSWVLPGNTADSKTVEQVRKDLRGWNLNRAMFVADAGMNSEDNRKVLSRACGKYLLATAMSSVKEVDRDVLSKKGRYTTVKDNLQFKEVVVGDGERRRRYILCYNPREARRQQKHRSKVISRLERELAKHRQNDATAKWAIDLLASKRYKRYLKITKTKRIRIDRKKIADAQRYDGKWVIQTNDDTVTAEDAACGYKGLQIIERCFRSLKSTQIRMNPMYHWLPRRIETHIKICVVALLIERMAEVSCGRSWFRIREDLDTLQATQFRSPDHTFYRRNELSEGVRRVLKKLKIDPPKLVLSISE